MRDTDWRPSKCPKCGKWREAAENPVCSCEKEDYTMNVEIKTTTTYTTSDGAVFRVRSEAMQHEADLVDQDLSDKFDITPKAARWLRISYGGKELMKSHSLDEEGVWRVTGEDPNADMGGYHHNPYIGTFQGKLKDVVEKAVFSDNFFVWGSGGDIIKVDIEKV